jgi:predicted methyltransferase MtxX (methanogen marker protein 4)
MSDSILNVIEERASKNHPRIAIGVGSQGKDFSGKVIKAARAVDFADIIVVSAKIDGMKHLEVFESNDVEKDLVDLLCSGEVDAAVRGSCSSSTVLTELKKLLKQNKMGRIALLETAEGVGILSGGRKSDVGRHKNVDLSIKSAEKVVEVIKNQGFSNIKNYNILLEDAIVDHANFIIAPDGITGNLMFRTLAFLGSGRGYGAPMVGIEPVYVDTSRAGRAEDYIVSMKMAAALVRNPQLLGR